MPLPELYAHTPRDGTWHRLDDHLVAVAELARDHAEVFGAGGLGYVLGLLHDLGKINPGFQSYLRAMAAGLPHARHPHAVWGATLAYKMFRSQSAAASRWHEVVMPIAGHHSGLGNGAQVSQVVDLSLSDGAVDLEGMQTYLRTGIQAGRWSVSDIGFRHPAMGRETDRELLIRMLFSALVDADHLDTERHFDPQQAARRGQLPPLEALHEPFLAQQASLMAPRERPPTDVERVRQEVYAACLRAADGPTGIYRLTAPTGSGKTRSVLGFALAHARHHGLNRIVVVAPYTSIIDQTARVYRDLVGQDAVLEHHSQMVLPSDEAQDERAVRLRLATTNWDAPIIVTTMIQLFESLLSRYPARVRKLHRLARSVVILDEVQTLPSELLLPTLDVLRSLALHYGVTVVFSTATQPALESPRIAGVFPRELVHDIVPDVDEHFRLLRRVTYEFLKTPMTWAQVANEISGHEQVLVIVNRRPDALALLGALGEDSGVVHLSTLLCPAHRRQALAEVQRRLGTGEPVRLITTQVIEAGVDIDFPEVWRAIGPLDRIIQAAGRANRHGLRPGARVVVFVPAEGAAPPGPYRHGTKVAMNLLEANPAESLHDPTLSAEYFRQFYADLPLDKHDVQRYRATLDFPAVEEKYRLIVDDTVPVVVPWGDSADRLRAWQTQPSRETWQQLQPYLVNLERRQADRLAADGRLAHTRDGLLVWNDVYDEKIGIGMLDDPADLHERRSDARNPH